MNSRVSRGLFFGFLACIIGLANASCGYVVEEPVAPPLVVENWFVPKDGAYAIRLDPEHKLKTDEEALGVYLEYMMPSSSERADYSMDALALGEGIELKLVRRRLPGAVLKEFAGMGGAERIKRLKSEFALARSLDVKSASIIEAQGAESVLLVRFSPIADGKKDRLMLEAFVGDALLNIAVDAEAADLPAGLEEAVVAAAKTFTTDPEDVANARRLLRDQELAAQARASSKPAISGYQSGFWDGLYQGGLLPFRAALVFIFRYDWEIVASQTIGFGYWAGFVLGLILLLGIGMSGAARSR